MNGGYVLGHEKAICNSASMYHASSTNIDNIIKETVYD
jgi:hypothetical protein